MDIMVKILMYAILYNSSELLRICFFFLFKHVMCFGTLRVVMDRFYMPESVTMLVC